MTNTETQSHEIRFAPRGNDPYRVECSCGWDAVSFSIAASPARNVANIRRTGQAHVRAASRVKAVATPGCLCCGLLAMRGDQLPCGDCR